MTRNVSSPLGAEDTPNCLWSLATSALRGIRPKLFGYCSQSAHARDTDRLPQTARQAMQPGVCFPISAETKAPGSARRTEMLDAPNAFTIAASYAYPLGGKSGNQALHARFVHCRVRSTLRLAAWSTWARISIEFRRDAACPAKPRRRARRARRRYSATGASGGVDRKLPIQQSVDADRGLPKVRAGSCVRCRSSSRSARSLGRENRPVRSNCGAVRHAGRSRADDEAVRRHVVRGTRVGRVAEPTEG